MHNTPPEPMIRLRNEQELLHGLCVALRDVGVYDHHLPEGGRAIRAVEDVRAIHAELTRRGISCDERLQELSVQTRWKMADLLQDCLRFPAVIPFVKEEDGIRRRLRCMRCLRAERSVPQSSFWMCDACLRAVIDAIDAREPIDGIVLFRTYTSSARCDHADGETVLASDYSGEGIFGNCRQCFSDELQRRRDIVGGAPVAERGR